MKHKVKKLTLPRHLYRYDDGERFTLQPDDTYTMDKSMMIPKYRYSYQSLRNNGFVTSLSDCE